MEAAVKQQQDATDTGAQTAAPVAVTPVAQAPQALPADATSSPAASDPELLRLTEKIIDKNGHASVSTEGKTAAEYTFDAMKMHQDQYKNQGVAVPSALKWVGDASLAVPPKNRFYSAIGLLVGLKVVGNMANILTGRALMDGSAIAKDKVPTYLQFMHGKMSYDPAATANPRNKWMKYAHYAIYSLGGAVGVKIGSDMAYKDVEERNKNPHYLEEALTRISHIEGKTWAWLSASSSIWGSSSGTFYMPIPGINYGVGMVGRVTSMQDRNTMIGGLNQLTSGATTASYLRLNEGMHYLTHYAVGNPEKDPTQIEYLAYTLLGPIFKDKLTADHIKQFTDAVHTVRDKYLQEGGIPKEKQAEATATMKEVFTGAGLEVLLIDMGLNPGTVRFDQVNGAFGKLGNVGQKKEIKKVQENYWKDLEGRLDKYVESGVISRESADWVREGINLTREGKEQTSAPPKHIENIGEQVIICADKDKISANEPCVAGTAAAALGIKRKQSSAEKLIKAAEGKGDWRETVLQQRINTSSPRIVSE